MAISAAIADAAQMTTFSQSVSPSMADGALRTDGAGRGGSCADGAGVGRGAAAATGLVSGLQTGGTRTISQEMLVGGVRLGVRNSSRASSPLR